jgi:hypothetical protein
MPSWKKVLQSGSAIHVLNITASGLPNTTQANIIGITSTGQFTQFSTSSLVGGGNNSIIGGSGTQNYITRWDGGTTITTSSIYESNGNIGIGTTNPQQKLHVSGGHVKISNNNDAFLEIITSESNNAYIDLVNTGSIPYNDYGLRIIRQQDNASYIYHRGEGNFALHAMESADIVFYTTNAERMRITSTGNVGIGTNVPNNKLQVAGGITVVNITASNLPQVSQTYVVGYNPTTGELTYFSTSSLGSGGSIIGGSGTTNYITRWSSSTLITTSSIYESGSRIGIGTGAVLPNATLQIVGTLNNGIYSTASGDYSHAEGIYTLASGSYSHAEGEYTIAKGYSSHAEGSFTITSGSHSHAEGSSTIASGYASHAEGAGTLASGIFSHAEGQYTTAEGYGSKAIGLYTYAKSNSQFVIGRYNNTSSNLPTSFIIGNGTIPNNHPGITGGARKNLVEIKPHNNISDFFGPVRITRTEETSTQDPDILRDQNKAGIIYMGFTHLFNTESRGPSPPIAVKINNTATNGINYGALRHPYTDGATSAINPAYALLKIDNAQYNSPSPSLGIGRTSNPFNVINTGIFTDGAVTAQEFRALGSWAISQTSDIRLKKNRPDTNDAFDRINGSFDVGVIAQDVLKNGFDHLVRTAKNEKMPEHIGDDGEISEKGYEFSVSYVGMIPYHAKVIKYLLDEVKELKSEIERLRKNGNT